MGGGSIAGKMERFSKDIFGWEREKGKVRYYIPTDPVYNHIGEVMCANRRSFFLNMNSQLLHVKTDIYIAY